MPDGNVQGMDSLDGGGLGSPTEPTGGPSCQNWPYRSSGPRTRRGRAAPVYSIIDKAARGDKRTADATSASPDEGSSALATLAVVDIAEAAP
jgi:hypothetical protein